MVTGTPGTRVTGTSTEPGRRAGRGGDAIDGEATTDRVIDLFKALSHPLRLQLVQLLTGGGHAVHELVDALGVPQPLVSQHLAVLRAARLVEAERVGREVRYSLRDDHVAHIVGDALDHAAEEH